MSSGLYSGASGLALGTGLYANVSGLWGGASGFVTGDGASLSLNFLAGAPLDSRITFTRGSTATFVGSNGLIQSAAINAPRFDYDPVTLACKGLLIEEQRTNLVLYSQDFADASWVKSSATVNSDTYVAPDGTTTGDTITPSGVSGVVERTVTFTGNGDKAVSIFLKAGTSALTYIFIRDTTALATRGRALITWTAGVPSAVADSGGTIQGIDNFANGWYRIRLLVTGVVAANSNAFRVQPDAAAGTGSVIAWGAQAENGAFATSYIPTVASQVTRAADVAAITGPNFTPWYNQSAGSFVVETVTFKPTSVSATGLIIDVSDGSINNRDYLGFISAAAEARTTVGGVNQAVINQNYTANAVEKLAYAVAVNDFAFVRNGSVVGTDTSGTIPTVDRMFIGNAAGTAAFLNGHIRSIRFYPSRLTNAQLQALTA